MTFSLLNILQVLIAFQGCVFALHLLLGQRGKRSANRCLAGLLGLLAVHMGSNVTADLGWTSRGIVWPQLFALLYGPLLYMHVWALTHDTFRRGLEAWLHGVPFVVANLLWLNGDLTVPTLALSIFASLGTYLALSFLTLGHYRRVLQATRTPTESMTLDWLRTILRMLTVVWVLDVVSYVSNSGARPEVEHAMTVVLFLALLAVVTWMVRKGLAQPELFAGITADDEAVVVDAESPTQAPRSAEEVAKAEAFEGFMEQERPFLQADLTLSSLAKQLDVAPRQLSQLIHRHTGSHFSDCISGYRVAAAQQELERRDAEPRTILDIAYAVGFNSKSSFNSAFKRQTGLTPSQFRGQLEKPSTPSS